MTKVKRVGFVFVLCKTHLKKVFGDVLNREQAFPDNTNMHIKKKQNWAFFPNRLVQGFDQKFDILSTFPFMQNTPRKSIW